MPARTFYELAITIMYIIFLSPRIVNGFTSCSGRVNISRSYLACLKLSRSSITSTIKENEHATVSIEDLVALCKRRGFVFQSSEIYNGLSGFFDYGPLGAELKKNIKDIWWRDIVHRRTDIVGLDSSIISSPKIWEASGHVSGFSDPMVDCKESKLRYRADQVFYSRIYIEESGECLGAVCVVESEKMLEEAVKQAEKMKKSLNKSGKISTFELKDLTFASEEDLSIIPSPATGTPGVLTPPRDFNLMFSTSVGANVSGSNIAYLRPETAQGIFTNFKNVQQSARAKIPFGIAQIGKAFRNEITPRNFIFRSREFEQMEVEYFIEDDDEKWKDYHRQWIDISWNWLKSIGLKEELMGIDIHPPNKLSHYARACTDITFQFPFGQSELQGIAARGCYDLNQHSVASGKSMEFFDEATKSKFMPHVIEPSLGVDRLFLALLVGGEKRTILKFHPSVAPIKVAIFPLLKNKIELVTKAEQIYHVLSRRFCCFWDTSGAIGRRYRRMDEAGTPFCITVDFETLQNDTVTLRDRDTTDQVRMNIKEIFSFLDEAIHGKINI